MARRYYLAIDIGASSGRHVLGSVVDGKIELEEVHRFDNVQVRRRGHDCWDIDMIWENILVGLEKCREAGKIPETIGIDTWGVDFVLVDAQGRRVGDAVAYRDARTNDVAADVDAGIGLENLYRATGIQRQTFNTVYQLAALVAEHPDELEAADRFLMVPEYLNYLLTGNMVNEYTNATTTNLVNARTFEELTADFEKACSLIPGKKRINLHASYAIFTDENPWVDRDRIEYKHFEPWVAWAKEHGFGIDFNPTLFSHPVVKEGLTVSSPDKDVRDFWIRHCIDCRKIAERIGEELDDMVLNNFWIPDGLKDYPADRYGMRERLRDALDEIYSFDTPHVIDAMEQKVFGIGVEGFTTGNQEFYVSYAAKKGGNHVVLIDAGHFNPMENIADKLSSLLLFFPYVPLHVTRSMHWDSDHVVLFDDNIKEIAGEIVRCPGGWDKVIIGLDFFDASINRIGAWATGTRAMEKSLLFELLQPVERLKELQDTYRFSEKMIVTEQFKTMPFGAVWDEYCRREGVPTDGGLWEPIKAYEDEVLSGRA